MTRASSIITKVSLGLVGVVGAIAVGVASIKSASTKPLAMNTPGAATTTSTNSTNTASSGVATATNFKDGTYTATGSYDSPGGEESITINLTLKDNVVTATSAKSGSNSSDSRVYQDEFISGYKSMVVGKKITDIQLSYVSGSSLTSQGFNDALQQIENQAKV